MQVKLHSLYYLFSFLGSSTFINDNIIHTALTYLLSYINENTDKYFQKNKCLKQHIANLKSSDNIGALVRQKSKETEETKSLQDDIFIFTLQSLLWLTCEHFSSLKKEQQLDLCEGFDCYFDNNKDLASFLILENPLFRSIFERLKRLLSFDCATYKLLVDLLPNPESQSPKKLTPKKEEISMKCSTLKLDKNYHIIDYFPFEPVSLPFCYNFLDNFINGISMNSSYFSEMVSCSSDEREICYSFKEITSVKSSKNEKLNKGDFSTVSPIRNGKRGIDEVEYNSRNKLFSKPVKRMH